MADGGVQPLFGGDTYILSQHIKVNLIGFRANTT